MRTFGLEPDLITYNAVILACDRGGQYDMVLSLVLEMLNRSLHPDEITFKSVNRAIEKSQSHNLVNELRAHLKRRGCHTF